MGGRDSLIYGEFWKLLDEQGIRKKRKRQELFEAVRVMERETLKAWAEQREKKTG